MKSDLLKLLKSKDDYVSGEEISQIFNVSRSAIWKHIKALKEAGYVIEGVSKKGYKLISSPDLLSKEEILSELNTKFIGKNIEYFSEVPSTNDTAKSLSSTAQDGTLIITEKQAGGKGRLGRIWSSPSGGIWMSLLLKPTIEPIQANKITQITAAALINCLSDIGINGKIKWPNDIYINGKKAVGILTEMKCDMEVVHYLVVGIGINVNLNAEDFPEDVLKTATSLKIEFDKEFNRTEIITKFLKEFEELYLSFVNDNKLDKVVDICKKNSIILDKDAYLVRGNTKEKVHCIGINDQGELMVRDEKGNVKAVISGEITFRI